MYRINKAKKIINAKYSKKIKDLDREADNLDDNIENTYEKINSNNLSPSNRKKLTKRRDELMKKWKNKQDEVQKLINESEKEVKRLRQELKNKDDLLTKKPRPPPKK